MVELWHIILSVNQFLGSCMARIIVYSFIGWLHFFGSCKVKQSVYFWGGFEVLLWIMGLDTRGT